LPIDDEVAVTNAAAVPTPESCFFWMSSVDGWLRILRCERCGYWVHPPLPRCPACNTRPLEPTPVSGEGRIAALPDGIPIDMAHRQVNATVELAEQPGLEVAARVLILDSTPRVGSAVRLDPGGDRPTNLPIFLLSSPDRS
jgi:uncharacterized OB-fold protein